jgi:hypothetical protein
VQADATAMRTQLRFGDLRQSAAARMNRRPQCSSGVGGYGGDVNAAALACCPRNRGLGRWRDAQGCLRLGRLSAVSYNVFERPLNLCTHRRFAFAEQKRRFAAPAE